MKTFIGSKLVKAKPMDNYTFLEQVKGGEVDVPGEEVPEQAEGFLVEYPDGYQSWNTMDEFNRISRVITDDEYRSFFGVEPDGNLDENGFQWYIQTKVVNADPVSKAGFEGRDIDSGTSSEAGYKVIYPNGHESWSPAVKFEEAYRVLNGDERLRVYQTDPIVESYEDKDTEG